MYEIVNKEGILRARFDSKSDSDRYISAVAEISKYKDSLRANGDSDIDSFISANKELVDIYDIRSILHLLNAAITGSSQFKLTDRIVPLVRFFFSTNTQTADTSVFELFALFSKSEMQSLVKYFRNIHSKNPSFRTCRSHDVRQAILVFIVAASVSDFDQFLQARVDASYSEYEVFLLQNLQEPTNTFFEAVCALTQGFTLSSGLVALAIKASSWLSKKTQKTNNIDIALKDELKNVVLTDPVLRLQNIALNIHTALGGDSQLDMYNFEQFYNISDFYSTTFDISKERLASALKDKELKKFDSFFGRSSIPLARALKDAELLNFCSFLNPRTYIYTSSPQILAEFTQVINSKYDSYTKNKDLCKAAFMVEDLTVVLLAYSLMSVIHILSQSAEAAQELSQRNFISYESALELCYDCASKVYKLSSKEIFDIYIKDLSLDRADPDKTLFEYQWPLLQEYLRTNADVLKYKIKDDLEMSQFIDFVEQNLQSYGRLLAFGTGSDASFCGLEIFLPGISLDYIFSHNTESLVEFDDLKERFQKFSNSSDSEILSSKPMEGLQVVSKLIEYPIDHRSFLKYKDQMGVYSKTNAESSVSVYILCRRHPLNLFVGHSKVSNCCMYPGSVGFECSVSAFENAILDFKNKSSTYIIVGYDHINESFIGSNWAYQIGAVKYLDSDNPSIVHSTAVDGLPEVYQLDQVELSISHNEFSDPIKRKAVKEFIELSAKAISECFETDLVLLNCGGYTEDSVKDLVDEFDGVNKYCWAEEVFDEEKGVCFGYKLRIYSDSNPPSGNKDAYAALGMSPFFMFRFSYDADTYSLKRVLQSEYEDKLRCKVCNSPNLSGDFESGVCSNCQMCCASCGKTFELKDILNKTVFCDRCECSRCEMFIEDGDSYCKNCSVVCRTCGNVDEKESMRFDEESGIYTCYYCSKK